MTQTTKRHGPLTEWGDKSQTTPDEIYDLKRLPSGDIKGIARHEREGWEIFHNTGGETIMRRRHVEN